MKGLPRMWPALAPLWLVLCLQATTQPLLSGVSKTCRICLICVSVSVSILETKQGPKEPTERRQLALIISLPVMYNCVACNDSTNMLLSSYTGCPSACHILSHTVTYCHIHRLSQRMSWRKASSTRSSPALWHVQSNWLKT